MKDMTENLLRWMKTNVPIWVIYCTLFTLWILIHASVIHYGTEQLPYHETFIGDERTPITGALHILSEKSLFAISNLETFYYGPLFAVLALPAVVFDFIVESLQSGSFSSALYKNHILYDWGGILVAARVIALAFSFLGLVALYKILIAKTINHSGVRILPALLVLLLATDYFYFSYGSFFRHWIFILVPALWQIYFLIRLYEEPSKSSFYLICHALCAVFAFGINYPAILSQVILLPWFYQRLRQASIAGLRETVVYFGIVILGCGALVLWHMRHAIVYLSIFSTDTLGVGQNEFSLTSPEDRTVSFPYHFEILLHNYYALAIVFFILLFFAYTNRCSFKNAQPVIISIFLFGLVYSLLLGFHPVHVARYFFPTSLGLISIVSTLLLIQYQLIPRIWRIVIICLIIFQILFHTVSSGFWLAAIHNGPEIRDTVEIILDTQRANPDLKQLVIPALLLGWPHTKESYAQYAQIVNEVERPLFISYQNSIVPTQINLLNVQYAKDYSGVVAEQYDRIYYCSQWMLLQDGMLEVDYPEVRLVRFWTTDRFWETSCAQLRND